MSHHRQARPENRLRRAQRVSDKEAKSKAMIKHAVPRPNLLTIVLGMYGLLVLTGCEEGVQMPAFLQPKPTADGAPASSPISFGRKVERDVEAPEIFQVTEAGLWDGRPSLGGVWVAHPDVTDPERVIIRNPSNGKFVIGALFRRERETPGPRLQVSSDAASALGLVAGAPTNLNVTALRR